MPSSVRVAIIQARAEYYDLPKCLDKAESLIREAARDGAQMVTLGETWLPGYPAWLDYCPNAALWDHKPVKRVYARLCQNSPTVDGPEITRLRQLAKALDIVLALGINERVAHGPGNGSLYNSLLIIKGDGAIANHHRKLRPTFSERMLWAPGDGAGLRAAETKIGRVGGLICWEHWMPLARQALHNSGETIHVALWPAVKPLHLVASQHYAFEGRTFVLAAGGIMRACDTPPELELPPDPRDMPDQLTLNGGSAIFGPDGAVITDPVYDEEAIITADLDPQRILEEQLALDVTGHYARDDVFNFSVNHKRP